MTTIRQSARIRTFISCAQCISESHLNGLANSLLIVINIATLIVLYHRIEDRKMQQVPD